MAERAVAHDTLPERLGAYVGKPFRPARTSKDPVNEPMIRHLVEALGDENPVYVDEEFAKRTVHGGIVAPPTSLQVWTMAGLEPWPPDPDDKQAGVMQLLDDHGYTSVVATNCEQEYVRYLRPGDVLTVHTELEDVSGPKKTGLGEGYFLTTVETYTDAAGELVGRMRFRILKFKPVERPRSDGGGTRDPEDDGPEAPRSRRPRPSVGPDNEAFWDGVAQGEIRLQRCAACGALRHPWQPACRECHSLEWDHVVASGVGEIHSFVVHHHPPLPGFDPPYVVGLVDLREGVRMVGEIVGIEPSEVTIGMPVSVVFTAVDDELTVPQWRPVDGGTSAEEPT